jgi:hypothetical protein
MDTYDITFTEAEMGVLLHALNHYYTDNPYLTDDIEEIYETLFNKIEEALS